MAAIMATSPHSTILGLFVFFVILSDMGGWGPTGEAPNCQDEVSQFAITINHAITQVE